MSKILLIEDDQAFSESTREIMEGAGYDVISTRDGSRGEILLHQEKPDLVVTDLIMPNKDGLGFIISVSNDCGEFPCKIIAMSGGGKQGFGAQGFLNMAKQLGVNDILEKPFSMQDLLTSIERQIG